MSYFEPNVHFRQVEPIEPEYAEINGHGNAALKCCNFGKI